MPKKAMETLTETMFYVLMAFQQGPLCGTDAAELILRRSGGRLRQDDGFNRTNQAPYT